MRLKKGGCLGNTPEEGPDIRILDQLEDLYKPVQFTHKLHAQMAEMGESCVTCHHYCPAGKTPPCRECHGKSSSETQNLSKPGLKGIYHRQCMGCHRQWSHDTECRICHIPVEELSLKETESDKADIMETPQPRITAPVKDVYHTSYDEAPVVTFYHEQHVELFNLRCVDCHQKENCSYCHDLQKPAGLAKTPDEMHDICAGCHDIDRCEICHDTKEKPAFSHASTGWPLSTYHANMECRACHPTGKRIAKLRKSCISCHSGWNQETFKHAVTGFRLDEIHSEMDCGDCHIDQRFERKPDCSVCHDDNRSPKSHPPGKYLKLSRK